MLVELQNMSKIWKANNTEKYEHRLDKERARAKNNYSKVAFMLQAEKAEQRRRWAEKNLPKENGNDKRNKDTQIQRNVSRGKERIWKKKKNRTRATKKKIKYNKSSTEHEIVGPQFLEGFNIFNQTCQHPQRNMQVLYLLWQKHNKKRES